MSQTSAQQFPEDAAAPALIAVSTPAESSRPHSPAPFGIFGACPAPELAAGLEETPLDGREPLGRDGSAHSARKRWLNHPLLVRLLHFLEKQPVSWLWTEAIALMLVVGFLDYITGYEVSVVLFYSFPILMMVRFADQKSAVCMALLCAIVWWWADEASGHHYTLVWYQTWETIVRLAYFLLFVVGGSAIKSRFELVDHKQRLEREIIRISEREQHRIGQDLHDGLCQYFAAVACSAGTTRSRLEKAGSPEAKAVGEIQDLLLSGVQQTRTLARGLFPVQSDEWGLPSALGELASSATRLLNLDCTYWSNVSTVPITNPCSTHLFRIAQEALSNAVRHGNATSATIRLKHADRTLTLSVEDNGRGFGQAASDGKGLGITIMRYRARQIGAQMAFENNQDRGATVTCSLPLSETPAATL